MFRSALRCMPLPIAFVMVWELAGVAAAQGLYLEADWLTEPEFTGTGVSGPVALEPEVSSNPVEYTVGLSLGRIGGEASWLKLEASDAGTVTKPGIYVDLSGYDDPRTHRLDGVTEPFGWYEDTYCYKQVPVSDGCKTTYVPTAFRKEAAWDPERGVFTWDASRDVDLESLKATLKVPVVRGDAFTASLLAGCHRLDWEETQDQDLAGIYHAEYTDVYLRRGADPESFTGDDYERVINDLFERSTTVQTFGAVVFHPQGPALGASAQLRLSERLQLTGSFLHSWLKGTAEYSGSGILGGDEMHRTTTTEYPPDPDEDPVMNVEETGLARSVLLDLPATEQECDLTATEAKVGLEFDLTANLFARLGYSWTRWEGLPTAPTWELTGTTPGWVDGEWTLNAPSDVELKSWRAGVGIRF